MCKVNGCDNCYTYTCVSTTFLRLLLSFSQSLVGAKGVLGLISKRLLVVVLVAREGITDLLGVRLLGLGLGSRSSRLNIRRQKSVTGLENGEITCRLTSVLPLMVSLACSR